MKLLLFYRIALVVLLMVMTQTGLFAWGGGGIDKPIRRKWANVSPMFQDSTARKKSSDKPKEAQRPPQNVVEERLKEAQRREIKHVPRSIPKLKPQPVSEGMNIRRPPTKAPKKGMSGYRFNKIGSNS